MSHRKFLDIVDLEDLKTRGKLDDLKKLLDQELKEAIELNGELADSIEAIREALKQIARESGED